MQRYVMFSPIGTTDPISNYHDGAMLHIARVYKPEKIYLYLSSEMCELHEMDDRYRRAISLLAGRVGFSPDTLVYERHKLTQVHLFDCFYDEFGELIGDIAEQNPGCAILLNVSSGTPAMKGALQTLAAFSGGDCLVPIQVSTPEARANPRKDDFRESALEVEWEYDEDNKDGYTNRTQISTTLNLGVRLKKSAVAKHIEAYDYHAALVMAKEIESHIAPDAMKLLEAAGARILLDISGVTKALAGTQYKIIPIENVTLRDMAEYLLWLELKERRAEYPDFIRGVTPLIADLLETYISRKLGINLWDYCSNDNRQNGRLKLDGYRLEKDDNGRIILNALGQEYGNGYRYGIDCSSEHMISIIGAFSSVPPSVEKLREVEKSCRNPAAHEIVSITPAWIKNKCKCSPEEIMALLFDLADTVGMPRTKLKNSYDDMNVKILTALGCRPQ